MKSPVELNSLLSNSFVLSPGLLYHLIRRDTGRLANETFTSNHGDIKSYCFFETILNGLKTTNCTCRTTHFPAPRPRRESNFS